MSVFARLSCALAGSILVAAVACEEPTVPEEALAPDAPALGRSPSKKTPTGPLNLRTTGNTSWTVSFAWDALSGTASYRLRDNWGREISVPGTQTSVTWKYPHPPLQNGATYSFSAYAVDAAGNKSASSNTVTVSLPLDKEAPTVPTFTVTSVGTRHIGLAWSSTDDAPFISYQVTKDGVPISSGGCVRGHASKHHRGKRLGRAFGDRVTLLRGSGRRGGVSGSYLLTLRHAG